MDVGKNSITIEATGDADKLSGMVNLLRAYGVREIIRTGRIAMQRSTHEN